MKNYSARVPSVDDTSAPADAPPASAPETGGKLVRFNLALKPEIAKVLKGYAKKNDVTVTETIRRALSVLELVDEIQDNDQSLAVGRNNVYREILFRW